MKMQEIALLQRDAVAEVDEKLREQGGRMSGVKDISEIWSQQIIHTTPVHRDAAGHCQASSSSRLPSAKQCSVP